MKYLGPEAPKGLAYAVASVSGTILAVCSCAICSPASTAWGPGWGQQSPSFTQGPAINVLAIILTARILGMELGVARAIGAILFSGPDDGVSVPEGGTGKDQEARDHA